MKVVNNPLNKHKTYSDGSREDMQLASLSHRMDDLDVKIKMLESKHGRELTRTEDARRKRCKANWGVVYDELANERGPWGGGAMDSSDVSIFF